MGTIESPRETGTTASLSGATTTFSGHTSSTSNSWITHTFEVTNEESLTATLSWTSNADLNLFLRDPAGNSIDYSNRSNNPEVVSTDALSPGTWVLNIKCKSGAAEYRLDIETVSPEIVAQFEGITSASSGSWLTHTFEANEGDAISATLKWSDASADLNLFLRSPSGKLIDFANSTDTRPETVYGVATESGAWVLNIKCKSGSTDYVLTVDGGSATPPPAPEPQPEPQPEPLADFPANPALGTVFWGCSIGGTSSDDRLGDHERAAGHPVSLHRTFYQWRHRTTGWLINNVNDDHAAGRLPWVSLKPPSWEAMARGDHDDEIDQLLEMLEATGRPVWLTLHHEPEGGGGVNSPDDPGGPSAHVAMNRRVRQRMDALGTTHIALAPILMSYTWSSYSGRDPEEWWAPGIYDFLAVDHYQKTETSPMTERWFQIRQFAADKGVQLAVGEWGMRGSDAGAGERMRDWYNHALESDRDGRGARIIGLSAFDSNLNSPEGGWELFGDQLSVFRDLLSLPTTADVNDY